MSQEPDYYVEIEGLDDATSKPSDNGRGQRWIGVRFDCCGTYQRIYCNRDGSAYEGRCPRCLQQVRAIIGPGGTPSRFFVAE